MGFGPIGRDLTRKLISRGDRFYIASISDSSVAIYPKDDSQVLEAIRWKEESKDQKLSGLAQVKRSAEGETLQGLDYSGAAVAVDVTNSDYAKPEDARKRALATLGAGKHFVSANKVALSYYFNQIFDNARKKGLTIRFGATI